MAFSMKKERNITNSLAFKCISLFKQSAYIVIKGNMDTSHTEISDHDGKFSPVPFLQV